MRSSGRWDLPGPCTPGLGAGACAVVRLARKLAGAGSWAGPARWAVPPGQGHGVGRPVGRSVCKWMCLCPLCPLRWATSTG